MRVNISTLRMSLSNMTISNVNNPNPQYQNTSGALVYIDQAGEVSVDGLNVTFIH